jgi:hypothetical protein
MINPANVIKIFTNQASNLLSSAVPNNAVTTNVTTRRESEVGELLCGLLESIVDSHSHSVDIETTLDHDTIDNEWNHEMMSDNEAE